jgi:hypothetical protein
MTVHIVDNFYPDPDEVREKALKLFYYPGRRGKKMAFPGDRTLSSFSSENRLFLKNKLEKTIGKQITYFPHKNSNGAFTLGIKKDQEFLNWIHHDCSGYLERTTESVDGQAWACVIYLQPKATIDTGTALFRSVKTGLITKSDNLKIDRNAGFKGDWKSNNKDWELHTYVGNVYNRCVIYPANYWHAPFNASFGTDKATARLVQVGFFTTEK